MGNSCCMISVKPIVYGARDTASRLAIAKQLNQLQSDVRPRVPPILPLAVAHSSSMSLDLL